VLLFEGELTYNFHLNGSESLPLQPLSHYSKNNSTKSTASGAGNVSEPRLMSGNRRVEVVCAYISVFVQSERWMCQCLFTYSVAAVM
jgi:hypothetical protein